jgi:hypothetical protein
MGPSSILALLDENVGGNAETARQGADVGPSGTQDCKASPKPLPRAPACLKG